MQFLIQQFLGQTFFLIFPVHLAKFDNVPDVMFFLMYIYILVYVQLQKLAKGQVAIFRWGFYCVRNHLCLRMLSVVIIFLNYFFWRKNWNNEEIKKKSLGRKNANESVRGQLSLELFYTQYTKKIVRKFSFRSSTPKRYTHNELREDFWKNFWKKKFFLKKKYEQISPGGTFQPRRSVTWKKGWKNKNDFFVSIFFNFGDMVVRWKLVTFFYKVKKYSKSFKDFN